MSKAHKYALISSLLCLLIVIVLAQACSAALREDEPAPDSASPPVGAELSPDEVTGQESAALDEAALEAADRNAADQEAKEEAARKAEKKARKAEKKARKKREKAIKNFPVTVTEVSIMKGRGGDDGTYISLSVTNTGDEAISSFLFTYIGYDSYGEPRADADDEVFSYNGRIEPGQTLDLISEGYSWQLKDHTSEGWYDDYGADGYEDGDSGHYDDYYDSDGYTDSYETPFQTRDITRVTVSVYQAVSADGKTYRLSAADRPWSYTASL
jgi:hypothetical protein